MANNFIKYLVYTPDYILEKDDVKLLDTTSKEELVKTIFKRDGKKIIKSLLSKKKGKPDIDYRGVYIHPELSIVGIARIPENGVLEDYEKYIHLLNDDLANYVINNIINILDGKGTDDNGLNLIINKKVEEIIARKISAIFTYKGSVDKVTNLPKDNNKVGDTYNVTATGANYTWDGNKWDKLSETIDLSNLATKEEVKTLINEVKSKIPESKEYYLVKEEYKYKKVPNTYTEGLDNEVNPNNLFSNKYRDYLITDLNDTLVPLTFTIEDESALEQYAIDNKTKIGKWEFKSTPEKIMENINKNTIKIVYTYLLEFKPDSNFDFTKDSDKDGIPDYKDPSIEYTITFDTQGGSSVESKKIIKGDSLTLPTKDEVSYPEKELKNWERDSDKKLFNPGEVITDISKNEIFSAIWGYPIVTISFNPNGGTGPAMIPMSDCTYGDKIPLLKALFTPPDGKIFSHWEIIEGAESGAYIYEEKGNQVLYVGTKNIVLNAIWKDNSKYQILFTPQKSPSNIFMSGGRIAEIGRFNKDSFPLTLPKGYPYMSITSGIDVKFDYWEFKGKKYNSGDTVQLNRSDFELDSNGEYILEIISCYKIQIVFHPLETNNKIIQEGQEKVLSFLIAGTSINPDEVNYTKSKCEIVSDTPINGVKLELIKSGNDLILKATFAPEFRTTSGIHKYEIKAEIAKTGETIPYNCKGTIEIEFKGK